MLFPRLLTQHPSEAMHVQGNDSQSNTSGKSLPTFRPNTALYARRGSKRQDLHESVIVRLMRSIGVHRNKGTDCGMAVSLLNC